MSRSLALAALMATLALSACSMLRGTAGETTGGTSSKNCRSCERMCEIAGDEQDNEASVAKCKADCAKKCK
jgi:hypothetical protein